jgi:6-pyruvoyltetrahydropterin/6-carboxytetrahydropterin synthase
MYTVIVDTTFGARHQLTLGDGSKEPLHHHDWGIECAISAQKLDRMGLAIDFNRIRAMIDAVVDEFKDVELEKTPVFENMNSSAENVAEYMYNRLAKMLEHGLKLEYVEVREAPHCRARYSK